MKFIVHESPVRRGDSNYIARVDLAPFGLEGEVEQLWLRKLEDGSFEVCCIPFRVYGIALGDIVFLSVGGTTIVGLVRRSGRRVLRVLLMSTPDISSLTGEINVEVSRLGLMSEWSGDRHVAIDVPIGADVNILLGLFERSEAASRAFWEWADSTSFSPCEER